MDNLFIFFPRDALSVLIELKGQLLVHKKDIMHLAVKVRIPVFTIISDPERFDLRFMKNSMDCALMDR